ncbi:hypothetical protein EHI42_20755 [Rhizobium hidalgonense]|nr:hypothetical protein EHI42_20755 [Rhizobium hidalgonense]
MAEVHRPFFFSLKLGRLRAPSCSCRPFSYPPRCRVAAFQAGWHALSLTHRASENRNRFSEARCLDSGN